MGEINLDDAFCQDRHTIYDQLREESPVCPARLPNNQRVWIATRYEDARALLAHPSLSKDSNRATPLYARLAESEGVRRTYITKVLRDHMLNLDPPDHTRLRRLVGAAFTLRRVEQLRPRVEEIVRELLSAMSGQIDLVEDYAVPVSATVSGELFGVPVSERAEFRRLSQAIGQGATPEAVGRAFLEMADYLAALVARKREEPGDDLVTALVAARDEGDRLDEDELVSMVFLLLTAGFETTVHFVGNAVVALLTHPDQLALLRQDFSLLPKAVEELLRFDSPAGTATLRFTTEAVEVGGVTIPADEFVLVPIGAPNRDPDRFPDPHALDITRDAVGHVGFGHGIHHCLGAPLARLTGQVAIGRLVERFPDLALVEPEKLRWRNNSLFRAYEQVFVTV